MKHDELLNNTVKNIPPSGIRKFFEIAEKTEGVISLGVGEPDFDTPFHIREVGIYTLQKGKTFYTANSGLEELRIEICNYMNRRFNVNYDFETECLVSVGGSEGIDLAFRALINPGDEVIIPEPSFVSYSPCALFAGADVVPITLKSENEFKLTAKELDAVITNKSKILVLPFPNNPTGSIMEYEELKELVPLIKKHNLIVLSDEIYAELTYDKQHVSIASFDEIKDQVIVVSGFSKAYAMTGWRLGYCLGHPSFIKAMKLVHQYGIMCSPTNSQFAAVEAMKNGDSSVAMMRNSFKQRRNLLVKRLNEMGLPCFKPDGAFYVFPDIRNTGLTSTEFCEKLLAEEKVAVVPGGAFGCGGEGFIRISYAYSIEEIKLALEKIEKFLKKIKNNS